MRPKGVIYTSKHHSSHGVVLIFLPLFLRITYKFLRSAGAGIIAFAFVGLLFSYAPIFKEELFFYLGINNIKINPSSSDSSLVNIAEAERIIQVQEEAKSNGVNSYFSIIIPKINAASNIIANVDAGNEEEYLVALKKGVAHAKGTYFPGQGKSIYLFSHSTDTSYNVKLYNAVFYLLRKLEKGDKIYIYFADKKYVYEVQEKVVVSSEDTSFIVDKKEEEKLLLQTCDPPGTSWKRLIVIATPIK